MHTHTHTHAQKKKDQNDFKTEWGVDVQDRIRIICKNI